MSSPWDASPGVVSPVVVDEWHAASADARTNATTAILAFSIRTSRRLLTALRLDRGEHVDAPEPVVRIGPLAGHFRRRCGDTRPEPLPDDGVGLPLHHGRLTRRH